MKLSFQKKELFMLITAIVLLILLFFSLEWFWKKPIVDDLKRMKQERSTIQKLLDEKQTAADSNEGVSDENSYFLQKSLPLKPNIPELLLDIERAELSSNIFIQNVAVAESSNGVQIPVLSEESAQLLSPDLQKVTMSLQIEANKYNDFLHFLKELESNERIIRVESFSFSGPAEVMKAEDLDDKKLAIGLSISAYFMINMSSLESQTPSLEVSPGADKKTPINSLTVE